jgi:hypothetical protein
MKPPQAPRDLRTVLTRRRLLSGLAPAAIALSSPIWRPATAFGADAAATGAKRLIVLFSANGTIPQNFFPAGTQSNVPLTLGPILSPLEAHKTKMLVLKGVHMTSASLDQPGGPHMRGPACMLTCGKLLPGSFQGAGGPAGYPDRISMDQVVANKIGTTTRFKSLEFGVRVVGGAPLDCISYLGANQPNKVVDDPWAMYSRVFAGMNLGTNELAQLVARRKSVLDFLKNDIASLKVRVNADDRARLDRHLTAISGIEQGLQGATVSCTAPTLPAKSDPRKMEAFPDIAKLQMDMMLLAQTCGLTHVTTFMFANSDSWQYYPFAGVNEEHHGLSHNDPKDPVTVDKLTKINAWHATQVAYIMDKLDAIQEVGGGTMLDSTTLLWGNELGLGNTHSYTDIPWVLAGGGGYFKLGRYLQFNAQPHNDLMLSIMHSLGLTDTTFGIPDLSTGELSGLTTT